MQLATYGWSHSIVPLAFAPSAVSCSLAIHVFFFAFKMQLSSVLMCNRFYWYHIFVSSETFSMCRLSRLTPLKIKLASCLQSLWMASWKWNHIAKAACLADSAKIEILHRPVMNAESCQCDSEATVTCFILWIIWCIIIVPGLEFDMETGEQEFCSELASDMRKKTVADGSYLPMTN